MFFDKVIYLNFRKNKHAIVSCYRFSNNIFKNWLERVIMKLLTHNFLTSNIIKGVKNGYPLSIMVRYYVQ